MNTAAPGGLVVHAALGDPSDAAVVSDWARQRGIDAVQAADAEAALEGPWKRIDPC